MTEKYLLAINTAIGSCSVAVSKNNKILNKKAIVSDRGHSELLMPLIETVLNESELQVDKLSGFLVCTGPGNYTSLRVAISTVRGLSLACKKPACGISLFEIISTPENKVLVLIKGPAEKIYVQKFSKGLQINSPKLMDLSEIQKTKEFLGSKTVGYQAAKVGNLIGGNSYLETSMISFSRFISLGLEKLKKNCPRPAPLYIR